MITHQKTADARPIKVASSNNNGNLHSIWTGLTVLLILIMRDVTGFILKLLNDSI